MRARRPLLMLAAVAAMVVVYAGFVATPGGPRTGLGVDPDRLADAELDMWKAYYEQRNVALFIDLVSTTRAKYLCTWAGAARIAFHLARAAATFARLRGDYDQVLPDLERGYTLARDWSGAAYEPAAAARAELAWWVARRVPGQDAPDNVGRLIADLNALVYGLPPALMLEASVLRARAGRLRDLGGVNADWAEVSRLLHASYRSLSVAVSTSS